MGWNDFPFEEAQGLTGPPQGQKGKGVWVFEPNMKTWFFISLDNPNLKQEVQNEAINMQNLFINRLKPVKDL